MPPIWNVQLAPRAEKSLKKLDRPTASRLRAGLTRLAATEDPTTACKALSGPLVGLWRYHIGDYRIVLDIQCNTVTIIALDLGHRSRIYT